jgi:hypothetical protein
MLRLTRRERLVLTMVLFLLLTGWTVKAWRTAHPPPEVPEPTLISPNAHSQF